MRGRTSGPGIGRALRDGGIVAGLLFGAYLFVVIAPGSGTVGFDAFAYWSVDLGQPYAATAGHLGAFTYTPVVARLFAPVGLLSWPVFWWLWSAFLVGTAVWLGFDRRRLSGRRAVGVLGVLAFPPVALELYHGNVHVVIAAAIVLGFRYPAAWAVPLFTKVTPAVGLIWFLVRGEWRSLRTALIVCAVIGVVSLVLDLRLWQEWLTDVTITASGASLGQVAIPIPLLVRLPAAAVLVAWGGRTDRSWTVPAAATLALPILWPSGLAVLAALWPLYQRRPGLTDDATLGISRPA